MEVRIFPALPSRVGLRPRRESQRPSLPQHARHCPVLESGSSLGFLVYPPLQPFEAFYIGYQGEARYEFIYYLNSGTSELQRMFTVTIALSMGGTGMIKPEVTFPPGAPTPSLDVVLQLVRQCIVFDDLGTPAGAVTLRGAWNFQTPPGWDTVYSQVFNLTERPIAPMLVVRVETDWFAQNSEFRYLLQPGEGITVEPTMPIGQVFFVPREQVTLRDGTADELAAVARSKEEFLREKEAQKITTPYGMRYSPHYLRTSRARNASTGAGGGEDAAAVAPPSRVDSQGQDRAVRIQQSSINVASLVESSTIRKVGRNDPCPCGSGKKYKKCHGPEA